MIRRMLLRPMAARIAIATLVVSSAALLVIAVGILVVSQSLFRHLMQEHGATAAAAKGMFEQTVGTVFLLALLLGVVLSLGLAVVLARHLSRPLEQIGRAARRVAHGDYHARVPRQGPSEVISLADSFNKMAASLQEQERMRREFIINAAHELRTPLTNLQGYLEALRDNVIAPDPEIFASLHEEADRLVRLSHSLDLLAEGDSGMPPHAPITVDLAAAVRSAVDLARPAFDRRRISVEIRLPNAIGARSRPDELAQVLANLLQNASRYTPEGGRVTVTVEDRQADVLISVTNNGDGIPPADLPHVFERFYRVEKSRDRARGGAGIGLAIVKQLVESAGGRVGVESEDGLTRFWFTVPAGAIRSGLPSD
ncbi:MAG: HAMP domain-containing protein [Chloroflexi bacterium]|nr:MAG: HAMP domain-containing protein [Chloroflexota bacterium]